MVNDTPLPIGKILLGLLFALIGIGWLGTALATALLFGLDPKLLALPVALNASPATSIIAASTVNRQLLQSAKGIVVMAGMNAGVRAGGGAAVYMGYLF